MNELSELLGFLTETLKQGLSVAQDKVPEYVEQMLKYGLIANILECSVWVLLFVISSSIVFWVLMELPRKIKAYNENSSFFDFVFPEDWAVGFIAMIISLIVGTISLVGALITATVIIKIHVAPILYLIEQTTRML